MAAEIKFQNYDEHKVKTDETLASIAKKAGITWKQLAQFNWGTSTPKEINECLHDLVGCRQKTKNGKNYFFTSKDDPGIVYVPVASGHYKLQTGQTHEIQVVRPHLTTDIEVETVDDFLQVVGNVTVVLKRQEGGPDVEITSDDKGYGIAKGVLTGHYEVSVQGGGAAYFLRRTNLLNDDPDGELGEFNEAVIDTRQLTEALTQVVVSRIATAAQKQERKLLQQVYFRNDRQTAEGRGTETKVTEDSDLTALSQTLAVDNLALVAGWSGGDIDVSTLVSSVLPDFFSGCDGAPGNRGYFVWVLEPFADKPMMSLYGSSGGEAEHTFYLTKSAQALVGAYSAFEASGGQFFVDMMTKTYTIVVPGGKNVHLEDLVSSDDSERVIDAMNPHVASREQAIIYVLPTPGALAYLGLHGLSAPLENYGNQEGVNDRVHERNKTVCKRISKLYNDYVDEYVARVKATKTEEELRELGPPWAPYVMPLPANASKTRREELAESYDFHQLKAWKAVSTQIDYFGHRIAEGSSYLAIKMKYEVSDRPKHAEGHGDGHGAGHGGEGHGEGHGEDGGHGGDGHGEGAEGDGHEGGGAEGKGAEGGEGEGHEGGGAEGEGEGGGGGGGAGDAEGALKKGLPIHGLYAAVGVEIEGSLTFAFSDNDMQMLTGHEVKGVAEVGGMYKDAHFGLEYKRNLEKPDEWEVTLHTGPLETQVNKEGSVKVALMVLPEIYSEAQANPYDATFEGGMKIKTGALFNILKKIPFKSERFRHIIEKYGERCLPAEISIHFGVAGSRRETILALVSNAPGFFQRRGTEELVKLQWNSLTLDERSQLLTLGWNQCSWDLKSYADAKLPETMEQSWNDFSAAEQVAAIHLGFRHGADYQEKVESTRSKQTGWKAALQKRGCAVEEEDKKSSQGDDNQDSSGEAGEGSSQDTADGGVPPGGALAGSE